MDKLIGMKLNQCLDVFFKTLLIPTVFCGGVEGVVAHPDKESLVQKLLQHSAVNNGFVIEDRIIKKFAALGIHDSLTQQLHFCIYGILILYSPHGASGMRAYSSLIVKIASHVKALDGRTSIIEA
jgi:hypothetical protein